MLVLPRGLPNIERLRARGIEAVCEPQAGALKIGLLNLMPMKEDVEMDYYRLLNAEGVAVEFKLLKMSGLTYVHTPQEYMDRFYIDVADVWDEQLDGLIITGAAVEKLDFEDIRYWEQLLSLYEWADTHVGATLHICWASLAYLYGRFGVGKWLRSEKLFGIFPQRILVPDDPLFEGFGGKFNIPFSTHAGVVAEQLASCKELRVLAGSEATGPSVLRDKGGKNVLVVGHLEYDRDRLHYEYYRDLRLGRPIAVPQNYYEDDDPGKHVCETWMSGAARFFGNWLTGCARNDK